MLQLLRLLRHPVPLGQLRDVAGAAGMAANEVDAALAVATKRRAIAMTLIAGTVCLTRSSGT